MGLEIHVEKVTDFRTDEKGRSVCTVTEVGKLDGCSNFLDELNYNLDRGFGSGATYSFCEGQFLAIRKILADKVKKYEQKLNSGDYSDFWKSSKETDEEHKKRSEIFLNEDIKQLKYEIETLDEFFKENDIKILSDSEIQELIDLGEEDCYGQEFDVSASW